jgi:rod shape-determining protein MreC
MESILGRYRNLIVLMGVLFVQVLGLAIQVKRTKDSEPTRLIRVWAAGSVTPLERALVWAQTSSGNIWHNYFFLRGVRAENRSLKAQIEQLKLEQVRMSQDADQARRLQALLAFKEQFISKTMAAQVIGSSGSELSRVVYIDKGYEDGIKADMAVITADGIVGKIWRADNAHVSQVLLIDDQTSGVGALLDKTRLQGILRGTPSGEVTLEKVMSDETVPAGELVLTSGGDGVFPKGLLVGRVTRVTAGSELFLNIHVRPAANLHRLEEVLVVTKIDQRQAQPEVTSGARAIDILAARLPGVPVKSDAAGQEGASAAAASTAGSEAKPKVTPPPQASVGAPSVAPVSAKPADSNSTISSSSSGAVSSATDASTAAKVSPKPAKPAGDAKQKPPSQDRPD